MFALHDIDAGLHWILMKRINQKSANNLRLVVQFAKEAFFTVASDSRNGRVCSCILPAKIVAHVGPHCAEILNNGVTMLLIHKGDSISVDCWSTRLLQIEA